MIEFIFITAGILILFILFLGFKSDTPKQKEYDRKLKESLADEYIIDPETGIKLTLEQAESGHWIAHENEFRIIPEHELEKLPTKDERLAEIALNYLRESKEYLRTELTNEQFDFLEKTKILTEYDDWEYSNPFKFKKGIVLLPSVELNGTIHYKESHLMFWVKIDNINGHYFFREKSSSEKFLDLFRDDDDIKFSDYESFTLKKSHNIILIKNLLKHFENEKKLEIEIDNENLFIKTTKLVNLDDIIRIEKIVKNVC
ncbi:hypothetical protein [Psychroserpens sp. Hel_I_66]|uniref:hypothetical protein n=1 Tax=Psychroserpens sp. Hel_I_66 TaxID=1250004 RepID=UPI0006473BD9|nr:hypothetical protein [Psychroserpens sp. Hel_I_66]